MLLRFVLNFQYRSLLCGLAPVAKIAYIFSSLKCPGIK